MTRKSIREIRNEEFIAASITAIHKYGYASVTMTEIAKEIGATAASINYYFGTKEALMAATMQRLMEILKQAMLKQLQNAKSPKDRLMAICDANFDDSLFTDEHCSVWVQFWSYAPYSATLSRLHKINRSRVRSNFRAELKQILPSKTRETARRALQAYMDGYWLEATQSSTKIDATVARKEVRCVVTMLLEN